MFHALRFITPRLIRQTYWWAFILVFTTTTFGALAVTESKANLYFSENPIVFDPPIVIKNTIPCIPIRELIRYFDGQMIQSNKDYLYHITINDHQLTIGLNSPKMTVNGQKKQLKIPTFKYRTRLYAPLPDIIHAIGYDMVSANGHYYAQHKQVRPTPQEKKQPTPPVIYTPKTELKPNTPLPFSYAIQQPPSPHLSLYLPQSQKKMTVPSLTIQKKYYADLTEFLTFLGYSIQINDPHILMRKGATIFSFKSGSKTVKMSAHNDIHTRTLSHTPMIRNGQFFVELQPFLTDLGFDIIPNKQDYMILKKLHTMTVLDDRVIIKKNSLISMGNGTRLSDPPRIFWDFSYTACPNKPIYVDHDNLKAVTFGQKNTSCRMVFHLHHPIALTKSTIDRTSDELIFGPISHKTTSIPKRIHKTTQSNNGSLAGKIIVIDPGHGGGDPGAVTKTQDYEKYYTLDISRKLQHTLQKRGAKVIMIRTGDTNPSLYQRVKKINASNADFLVSVHVNSFINDQAHGSETYYYKASEKLAAHHIQQEFVTQLKLKNNGIKHAQMYVLKHSRMPGVLIEPCFITHPQNYKELKKPEFRQKIATATADGIERFFKNK